MIQLTRFNGKRVYLNAELIQTVEGTPDTVIQLVNGERILVKESPETVVRRVILYQNQVHNPQLALDNGD